MNGRMSLIQDLVLLLLNYEPVALNVLLVY